MGEGVGGGGVGEGGVGRGEGSWVMGRHVGWKLYMVALYT